MSVSEKDLAAELDALAVCLEQLLSQFVRLRNENHALKIELEVLVKEKAGLLEKHLQAKASLEAMILKLKTMEHDT